MINKQELIEALEVGLKGNQELEDKVKSGQYKASYKLFGELTQREAFIMTNTIRDCFNVFKEVANEL